MPVNGNIPECSAFDEAVLLLEDGTWQEGVVGAGFCQVVNNRVTIIVDTAEYPEEVDIRRANEAKERAKAVIVPVRSKRPYFHGVP